MSNSSNVSVDPATYDGYLGVSSTTTVIGILGGVGSVLGVLVLLVSAAYFDAKEFAGTGRGLIANVFIQFLTLYGTSASFFIFSQAATKTDSVFYVLSFIAVLLMLYAQVLLYCTSSAIGVAALPRAFIPSLAASVQFISALAISSGDFAPGATNAQKLMAWFVPALTLTATALMFGLRAATMPGALLSKVPGVQGASMSNIGKHPRLAGCTHASLHSLHSSHIGCVCRPTLLCARLVQTIRLQPPIRTLTACGMQ